MLLTEGFLGWDGWPEGCLRVGFININDMYNNDVGKESAQKFMKQTGDSRPPPFILLHKLHRHILPPDRHRYCTYRLY